VTRRRESRRVAEGPVPLGSVSQGGGPLLEGTRECQRCGSTDLVRIRMSTPTGRAAVFVSCPACEHRAWFALDGDGTPLSDEDVTGRPAGGPGAGR